MKMNRIGANQAEIFFGNDCTVLFSYNTPVACVINGALYKTEKYHSKTTSKHINAWLSGASFVTIKEQSFFDDVVRTDGLVKF